MASKGKYILIKIMGIVGLMMVVVLYFIIYFLPTLKDINRYRRELKDKNLKITDYVKMENKFKFSTQQERGFFKQADAALKSRIPRIRSREEFIALFTLISNDIQNQAQKDGIYNLVLTSESKDLKINASSLSSDKKTLDDLLSFTTQRLTRLRKEEEMAASRIPYNQKPAAPGSGLAALVPGVNFHTVSLSFTGDLKSALNFVNHITWSNYYLSQDKILISRGASNPFFIVFVRIYYIDLREKPAQQKYGTAP